MIASWMLYTLALSVLLGVAGVALERIGITFRRPVRFIWVAAMVGSVLLPPAAALERAIPRRSSAVQVMPFVIDVQRASAITAGPTGSDRAARVDAALTALWIVGSALLLFRLALAMRAIRRRTATWRRGEIDGVDVHLAPDAGPAVVGVRSMRVVLPEWILDLDQSLRALVIRHEEEHRAARDPYLLFGSAVAVALMPWNVALWWQARRLRLAIEMDCDARVLRAHPRPEHYGMLLLTIAQRRTFAPGMLAPMLSEPASHLERRIIAMRTTSIARLTVATGAGLAVLALGFACTLRSPDSVTGPRPESSNAAASRGRPQPVTANQTYFEFQVENEVRAIPQTPMPRFPDELRTAGVEGEVLAQFVVGTEGLVDTMTFKVLKTSHPLFTSAVRANLSAMRFSPALVGGRPVKQLVQMPFVFSLSGSGTTVTSPTGAIRPNREGRVGAPGVVRPTTRPPTDERAESNAKKFTGTPNVNQVYFEFQVHKPVQPQPGNAAPRYPDALRAANIEGEVLAQFVVDRDGRAEMNTFKVLKSSDSLFTETVLHALPNMRFNPAEISGQRVRQLVQMPFQFNLSKR